MEVRVRQANNAVGIEERINETLKSLESDNKEIVDIKYSTIHLGTSFKYSAMIIFK